MTTTESNRAEIARRANAGGMLSSNRGAPFVTVDSTRETLIAWLGWNDRNGTYSDDDCRREGMTPLTLTEAWALLAEMTAEETE